MLLPYSGNHLANILFVFYHLGSYNNHACSKFRSSQVSVKKHGPSNKEIIEKKIRKKDNRKKYVDIERDMINISHSEYIVKYFGYLEDQVGIDCYLDF